jgi:hypothetical protein
MDVLSGGQDYLTMLNESRSPLWRSLVPILSGRGEDQQRAGVGCIESHLSPTGASPSQTLEPTF